MTALYLAASVDSRGSELTNVTRTVQNLRKWNLGNVPLTAISFTYTQAIPIQD